MTTILKAPGDHELPKVENLGDEGQYLVAYGHVEPKLFVCLAFAGLAGIVGTDISSYLTDDVGLDEWAGNVEHVWAIEILAPDGPSEDDEDRLQWGGVTAATEGAFAITKLDLE